jgi:hypothetical protein
VPRGALGTGGERNSAFDVSMRAGEAAGFTSILGASTLGARETDMAERAVEFADDPCAFVEGGSIGA